jgi:hypothetical protein
VERDRLNCCSGCGFELPPEDINERKPCPKCGSLARDLSILVQDELKVREAITYKMKAMGEKKPSIEGKFGASLNRDTGEYYNIEQLVDRKNDRYVKRITTEGGTVLRNDDGKLSEHQGFGSAKRP